MNCFLTDSSDYSVLMALVDFWPVVLFFIAGIILLRDLYNKQVKGNYALLATGTIMIFVAGASKALWKILVAVEVCDYVILNSIFFPLQGIGFVFYGIALFGVLFKIEKNDNKLNMSLLPILALIPLVEVPIFDSKMPFIIFQIIGCAIGQWMLLVMALKMKSDNITKLKRIIAMVLFVISFITMIAMGYLSSQFKTGATEWIAEIVNTISQGSLLGGVVILHLYGLKKEVSKQYN